MKPSEVKLRVLRNYIFSLKHIEPMTIKNIRNFIKQHKELLMRRGIYKEHYKFSYKDYNILDVAGFLHRLICGVVG